MNDGIKRFWSRLRIGIAALVILNVAAIFWIRGEVLDFFGDELESLRLFDTTTQRTTWFQPDRSIYQFAHIYLNTGRRDAGGDLVLDTPPLAGHEFP